MTQQQTTQQTAQQPRPEQGPPSATEPEQAPSGERQDQPTVGPIDYLALEIPAARMHGEGLKALLDLVDRNIIQILDLRAAVVGTDGEITAVDIADLDGDGSMDLTVFTGARSGLLGDDDVAESAQLVEPGNAVAVLVYENTWARPFVSAMRGAGAELIAGGRIPATSVLAMLDELEATDTD